MKLTLEIVLTSKFKRNKDKPEWENIHTKEDNLRNKDNIKKKNDIKNEGDLKKATKKYRKAW